MKSSKRSKNSKMGWIPVGVAVVAAGALAVSLGDFGLFGKSDTSFAQKEEKEKDKAKEQPKPQYGGELSIVTFFSGMPLYAWDSADFHWKQTHDTGLVYEQLFVGDLSKSKRHGGKESFNPDGWLSPNAIRGELAESWEWKDDPKRIEIQLRKGVMFPEKEGVMKARELTADDVVFSFNRLDKSPRKVPGYFDYLSKVEATGKHTVVFTFKHPNAEWDYRFGYGYYSAIIPPEVDKAGAAEWKNLNGTGPFMMKDMVPGSAFTYEKNPNYWDKETIGGVAYKLPFVDKIIYPGIRDEATRLTALRTGKIDVLDTIRWSAVDELKRSAPQLQWAKTLAIGTSFLAMRMDTKPFDDIRVRRALNMAVDKQAIIKSYFGGQGEMLAYPMHPDYGDYYEPLDKMPAEVKELFTYDPEKAKKLLAEAGHPDGFSFEVQSAANSPEADLLAMVGGYLQKVGVKITIKPMEYGAFYKAMISGTNAPGYFMQNTPTNPTTSLRKNFVKGQQWNPSQHYDPEFEKRLDAVFLEPDEAKRKETLKQLNREMLAKAPYIWLPTQYVYTAWWPWVQNYGGELRAGAGRPGPIHARIWIDQEMKKKMGMGGK